MYVCMYTQAIRVRKLSNVLICVLLVVSGTVDVPVDPLLTAADDVELLQHALESRPDAHGYCFLYVCMYVRTYSMYACKLLYVCMYVCMYVCKSGILALV